MWMSLMSWLRSWPRIGNRCSPLIAKQYFTRFSRITRAINSPPSAFAITELLLWKFSRLPRILAHLRRRRKARVYFCRSNRGIEPIDGASGGLIPDAKPVSFEHRSAEPACAGPSTWTAGGGVVEEWPNANRRSLIPGFHDAARSRLTHFNHGVCRGGIDGACLLADGSRHLELAAVRLELVQTPGSQLVAGHSGA